MATFTVRITEENGNPVAWIDRDNSICIKQPHRPGTDSSNVWSSVEEATEWANAHAVELQTIEDNKIAAEQAYAERVQAESQKLDEIHAMLTQLLNK